MYFCLKHGDDQSSVINLNCKVLNLLGYIRKVANINDNVEVDLSDLTGEVKHLPDFKFSYAINVLKEKETYVLLRVEKKHANETKAFYVALLNNDQIVNEDFLMHLNNNSSTASKRKQTNAATDRAVSKSNSSNKSKTNIVGGGGGGGHGGGGHGGGQQSPLQQQQSKSRRNILMQMAAVSSSSNSTLNDSFEK